jgi:signal transduction histidine kinase
LQHALNKGEGVLSSNAMSDPRFKAGDSVQQLSIRSAICSPIRFRDRTFGAIYIDSSIANYTFTPEQLALMNAIGQHTGLALANAELYSQKLRAERLAAMGETVASLSHSIKNILQGLRGGADVVELGLKRTDLRVASGGWGILKRNLDRIISLTMNMLAYSRPRTLEVELTRLAPLLDDCASLMQDTCAERGVALIVDADPDMPPVPVDAGQLHQALMNLVTNAVEAVPEQTGVVTLRAVFVGSAAAAKAEARIEVIDNGPGIPPEKAARIYEPFFTTKGLRGTGLGLAVTKRIVEQHRGTISLRPGSASAGGRGAHFTIVLPVDTESVIDPSQTAHPRLGREGGRAAGANANPEQAP